MIYIYFTVNFILLVLMFLITKSKTINKSSKRHYMGFYLLVIIIFNLLVHNIQRDLSEIIDYDQVTGISITHNNQSYHIDESEDLDQVLACMKACDMKRLVFEPRNLEELMVVELKSKNFSDMLYVYQEVVRVEGHYYKVKTSGLVKELMRLIEEKGYANK